jgi:hypothetical protein
VRRNLRTVIITNRNQRTWPLRLSGLTMPRFVQVLVRRSVAKVSDTVIDNVELQRTQRRHHEGTSHHDETAIDNVELQSTHRRYQEAGYTCYVYGADAAKVEVMRVKLTNTTALKQAFADSVT